MDSEGVSGMRNPLNTINPNDIETFTVLKDASATAIYGSRGANGVIEKLKPGSLVIDFGTSIPGSTRALAEECKAKGFPFTVDTGDTFDMGEAAGAFSYTEDPDGTLIELNAYAERYLGDLPEGTRIQELMIDFKSQMI